MNSENLLDDHRNMLVVSGSLSSFQIDNLKNFPKIAFDNIENFTLDYNFYDVDGDSKKLCSGKVTYNIKFKTEPKYNKQEKEKRIKDIILWVKSLFWKDTEVTIEKDGKKWT